MSTNKMTSNNMYRVGDFVYFETSPSSPYQIRRIQELNKTALGVVEAKVAVYYRRRDIPAKIIQSTDRKMEEQCANNLEEKSAAGCDDATHFSQRNSASADEDDWMRQIKAAISAAQSPNGSPPQHALSNGGSATNVASSSAETTNDIKVSATLLQDLQKYRIKQHEVYRSNTSETLPATHIRGKCSVALLIDVESLDSYVKDPPLPGYPLAHKSPSSSSSSFSTLSSSSFISKSGGAEEDMFFYRNVYYPDQRTIFAERGTIRIGSEFQATVPPIIASSSSSSCSSVASSSSSVLLPSSSLATTATGGAEGGGGSTSPSKQSGRRQMPDRKAHHQKRDTLVFSPVPAASSASSSAASCAIFTYLKLACSIGTLARAYDEMSAASKCASSSASGCAGVSLQLAMSQSGRDLTVQTAHDVLFECGLDVERALARLVQGGQLLLCRDQLEAWSPCETELFERGLEQCGKSFSAIQQHALPWKSVEALVEYYYMYKTTGRWFQKRRAEKPAAASSSAAAAASSASSASPSPSNTHANMTTACNTHAHTHTTTSLSLCASNGSGLAGAEQKLKQVYIPSYSLTNPAVLYQQHQTTLHQTLHHHQQQQQGEGHSEQPIRCKSCGSGGSPTWYAWRCFPHAGTLSWPVCAECWSYWKKFAALKYPVQRADFSLGFQNLPPETHQQQQQQQQQTLHHPPQQQQAGNAVAIPHSHNHQQNSATSSSSSTSSTSSTSSSSSSSSASSQQQQKQQEEHNQQRFSAANQNNRAVSAGSFSSQSMPAEAAVVMPPSESLHHHPHHHAYQKQPQQQQQSELAQAVAQSGSPCSQSGTAGGGGAKQSVTGWMCVSRADRLARLLCRSKPNLRRLARNPWRKGLCDCLSADWIAAKRAIRVLPSERRVRLLNYRISCKSIAKSVDRIITIASSSANPRLVHPVIQFSPTATAKNCHAVASSPLNGSVKRREPPQSEWQSQQQQQNGSGGSTNNIAARNSQLISASQTQNGGSADPLLKAVLKRARDEPANSNGEIPTNQIGQPVSSHQLQPTASAVTSSAGFGGVREVGGGDPAQKCLKLAEQDAVITNGSSN